MMSLEEKPFEKQMSEMLTTLKAKGKKGSKAIESLKDARKIALASILKVKGKK